MSGPAFLRPGSPRGQADVSTIITLACLCAAVFAGFFLIGRAASPHAQVVEPAPPSVDAVVAGVPARMSSAPAIAAAISPGRSSEHRRSVASTTPALAAGVTPVTAERPAGEPTRRAPVKESSPVGGTHQGAPSPATAPTTPTTPASKAPARAGGPGTSFDTSG